MTLNVGIDFTAEGAWPDLADRNIIHIAHGAPLAPATAAFFARLGLDLTELAP